MALSVFLFAGLLAAQGRYQKWLEEDVVYIITAAERQAFEHLNTDAERDRFIDQFWSRRNPAPGDALNPLKEEHYRRIAFANERFAAAVPGWKSDRGRVYIVFGPPDEDRVSPLRRRLRSLRTLALPACGGSRRYDF